MSAARRSGGAPRVLVVDDDQDIREIVGELLRLRGYEVEVACDGREALARIEARAPDVVLLDHRMPGLSGGEVASALQRRGCRVPVVLMSAFKDKSALVGEAGIVAFLAKPFEVEALTAALDRILGGA